MVRLSKTVLDSGFYAADSGFFGLNSGFQGPGFRIPQAKISRIWNPDYFTRGDRVACVSVHVIFQAKISSYLLFQSRFAVNSVTAADYGRPFRIAAFVAELDAGFRLLNLKNDSLRKKFDGLKYDLKKIEEVVYDLTIRGLKPASAVTETT